MLPDDVPWKRMRFRGDRVWAAVHEDGSLRVRDGKAAIKYRLESENQYWVQAEAVHPVAPRRSQQAAAQLSIDFGRRGRPACAPAVICVFAEAAVLADPGPAGIGVVLHYNGRERTQCTSIGSASEAAAAVEAIGRGLSAIRSRDLPTRVYSTNAYVYGVLALGWKARRHAARVEAVRRLMHRFSDIQMVWPAHHPEARGTRRAKELARQAAGAATGKAASCGESAGRKEDAQ